MNSENASRRRFLRSTMGGAFGIGLGVAAALSRSARGAEPKAGSGSIRLGGPLATPQDPEEMARAYRAKEYRAAYCPSVSLKDEARIRDIEAAFKKHDVVIAEVGRWVNMMDSDPEKRKANIQTVTDGLALADAIGAKCCVDIAGSFNKEVWYGPHEENLSERFFDLAVQNARKIIDAVKPKRAKFCYEMMGWALPDSPDSYLRMIQAVDRDAFGVHLDPCNLVNCPERFYRNGKLIEECFEKLGPWIVSCHAKDLTWDIEMNVHFREVRPGTGKVDYTVFLKKLAKLRHQPPLMLEHLPNAEEYDQARAYILEQGKSLGLSF